MQGANFLGKLWRCQSRIIIILFMGKLLGYMLTWTTYGSWLQGDERGYVKDGAVLKGDEEIKHINRINQKGKTVHLTKDECEVVRKAIIKRAEELGQVVYALSVNPMHVHMVAGNINKSIGKIAGQYKGCATAALKGSGSLDKVWTKGYDKRYCFDEESLERRIAYVRKHDKRGGN
jgi:hypothetical protein